jgi:hypothetical protein
MAAPLAGRSDYERGDYARSDYRRVDRVHTRDLSIVFRIVAAIAGAVPTVIGLIAIARVAWDAAGFDAPAVSVAGMTSTPAMAVGTAILGFLAMVAGATRDRASKLVMGGILVCIGIVALIARPETRYVVFEDAYGWMMAIVGAVLIVAALLMSVVGSSHRHVVDSESEYVR